MQLKITSSGTAKSTKVVDAATGELIENVLAVDISLDGFHVEAAILIRDPHLSLDNVEALEVHQGDNADEFTAQYDGGRGSSNNR